ncbi:hypothetical protein CROQUDRAFT_196962 [Cronartium quercuum f. sp. fusiforme G11]|uniref:[histone H3]-dimethyl-L-lysine(36) demethylase n=1 Tax=Cronartium quercuum f. sp. fusiforme G11 TaxID=708437 RepID=A0A9P6NUA8_9BASI|nr:hypothetical protein CROQUDRAFT_196962 [Cronartium quercuum f. sp. fusiforme G11]
MSWLMDDESAMTEPILIEDDDALRALGMKMPSSTITIRQISDIVGPDTPVEVIDVASQSELSRWTLDQWASYYEQPKRDKVRNVISLEVTETALGDSIELPRIVREMDWVETIWPQDVRVAGSKAYPKVQKYCLMSVARCWTDWHIDFAGSSVFYHVLRGSKTFYFIRPTPSNLEKYEEWSGDSDLQESTWLGDRVDVVYKVSLQAGHTMIIPTGWIHAVYTPVDSLVFGGNYLHSLNIPIQLRVHQIEINTKVPKKFRFPFFIRMLWYVAHHYQQKLDVIQRNPSKCPSETQQTIPENSNLDSLPHVPPRILSGLLALSEFLISQVSSIGAPSQNVNTEPKKLLSDGIDWERIPDPQNLARSLRQLVTSALSLTSSPDPQKKALLLEKPQKPALQVASRSRISSPAPSALHIKIKRKASNEPSKGISSGFSESESFKKPTSQHNDRPTKQTKLKQAAPSVLPPSKKDGATIVQKINEPPTTEITRGLRSRPTVDDSGQLVENPPQSSEMSEVEIRTTTSENRVVRQSTDELGRVMYETRCVRVVIEKVYFPTDDQTN